MNDPAADAIRRAAESHVPDEHAFELTMRRVRRRDIRRRVGAATVALTISAITAIAAIRALSPTGRDAARQPVTTVAPATEDARLGEAPPSWTWCGNRALGYRIAYPEGWHTSNVGTWPDGRREHVPEAACHFFDPDPYEIALTAANDPQDADGIDHRADRMVAFHLTVSSEPFDHALRRMREGKGWTILGEESMRVAGRSAVLLDYEDLQGWDIFIVDLSDRGTLWFSIAKRSTSDPGVAAAYDRNSTIGRRMLETFRIGT